MTDAHKEAIAKGREQAKAVRAYLDALDDRRSRRPRRRTPEQIEARLADVRRDLADASSLDALLLIQERLDLEGELNALSSPPEDDFDQVRLQFIKHAKGYAEAKGIAYSTWRTVGVPAETLREAGITRGG